jgi:ribosomal protein S18 acetylase RimI-like enzyme
MESIKSLDTIGFELLYAAFKEAFSDYEVQVNREELSIMLSRRGFDPSLSFGLFKDGKLISFTLNGIGAFNGVKTAYDSGTGTIKEYRGKGYASRIFSFSLPHLKEAGVSQYLLEVLQHNTNAVSVYRKLGFEVSCEYNYFIQQASLVNIPAKVLPSGYELREISSRQLGDMEDFGDFNPSWQNGYEAIWRRIEDFRIFVAFNDTTPVGYCIFEPGSGDVTQIAVAGAHRRIGIASALLTEALKTNLHANVKIINTEIECSNITYFLRSCGILPKGRQFEMIRKL